MLAAAARLAAVAVLAAAASTALAAPATATAQTWAIQPAPGPSGPPNAALTGVACPSATFCMAIGSSDYGFDRFGDLQPPVATFAADWNGSSWAVLPTPVAGVSPGLGSISCASATFCIAVGATQSGGRTGVVDLGRGLHEHALVELWNGSAWTLQKTPLSSVRGSGLSDVACVSSSFCVAVGSSGLVWNGTAWRQLKLPSVKYGSSLAAIACPAVDSCMAVGTYNPYKRGVEGSLPLAARWNGRRWTLARPPTELDRYRGKLYPNNTWLTSIACPSQSSCLATGQAERTQNFYPQGGFAIRWNGRSWATATSGILRDSPLNGVSCLSTDDCFAAGQYDVRTIPSPSTQQPLLLNWTGSRWQRVAIPPVATLVTKSWSVANDVNPDFFGISCVPASGCTAVGAQPGGTASLPLVLSDLAASAG